MGTWAVGRETCACCKESKYSCFTKIDALVYVCQDCRTLRYGKDYIIAYKSLYTGRAEQRLKLLDNKGDINV